MARAQPSEAELVTCIERNRSQLRRFSGDFDAAVKLFEYLEEQQNVAPHGQEKFRLLKWQFIAARDGAMTIYHFGHTLQSICECLKKTGTYRLGCDLAVIDVGKMTFEEKFQNWNELRQAVAHAGEHFKTPIAMKAHERNGGTFIAGLQEKTFAVGFLGKRFQLKLCNDSVETLATTLRQIDGALPKSS